MLRHWPRLISWLAVAALSVPASSVPATRSTRPSQSPGLLQDLVTWDEHSVYVRGERLMIFAGEYHPFRLPVPGLWLDVFQKIRSLGYTAVSFYVDWHLLEGQPGHFRADGVFALDEFFNSASQAGIYLIARPGPYINSETSGGGFPGWVTRLKAELRTTDAGFLDATSLYVSSISAIIAKAQITRGGPVILFQPENEYSICANYTSIDDINECLEKPYMAHVETQYRDGGIVLPFINNDALPIANFPPGSGAGAVDIYSFDSYPFGWGNSPCTNPSDWNRDGLLFPTTLFNYTTHQKISPTTPFSISEFQGGAPDPWGGVGIESCAALINNEFERVIYKVIYGFRAAIFGLYMTFGGTNWGNLGHPAGYTSYDVGAAITEDRLVSREKYSEAKLQAGFMYSSPAYLTTTPDSGQFGGVTGNPELIATTLAGNTTSFYVIRQADFASQDTQLYRLKVPTSVGNLTIPQLGGNLSLHGRDSKIHVVDYSAGDLDLVYSSAEVFTWKKSGPQTVLLLYGGADETHEFAVSSKFGRPSIIEGDGLRIKSLGSSTVVQWDVKPQRRVMSIGKDSYVYMLWRNDAYNYWPVDLPSPEPVGAYPSPSKSDSGLIVKAGYLIRSATVSDGAVHLYGDINATTPMEIIAGAPKGCNTVYFNDKRLSSIENDKHGRVSGVVPYNPPNLDLPSLVDLEWTYVDSLPESSTSYDDNSWTRCSNRTTNNPRNLTTPTSLYASDYGYHTGSLIYRGHFVANGSESTLSITTQGGLAFAYTLYLNSTHLGSYPGAGAKENLTKEYDLPALSSGRPYVITALLDHMGLEENFLVGSEQAKTPRGILAYSLAGRDAKDINWKMTGNLGGEAYQDLSRGPLNEGAMFAERQGYHLPGAKITGASKRSPFHQGITRSGVGFFATTFSLDVPFGWDIPLGFVFENTTRLGRPATKPANFRCQLYVNGWQFGKYINNIGPQSWFPVPEGIINHRGSNYISLTVWSQDPNGVKLAGLSLQPRAKILSSMKHPDLSPGSKWIPRKGAY